MAKAAFTVRVAPVDAKAKLARDDAQPRRFVVTRLAEKQLKDHPECVQVPFMDKPDVSTSTSASCYLQLWEFDHFDEGAGLERMETQEGGVGNRCLVVVPGVVARTVKGKNVTWEFLTIGTPEIIPDQTQNQNLGRLTLSLDYAAQGCFPPQTLYLGEYESICELSAVLRTTPGDRSFAGCDDPVVHILRNVAGSVWYQMQNRGGFAIAFVSDYPAGNAKNREFACQAEEMLATLATLRLEGNTLTMGHHLITHFNQMAGSMHDVRQAVQKVMADQFQVSIDPKVAVLEIYAHGEPHATNTNPNSWNPGSGTLRKEDVATFVTQIRDHITDDAVISLFACHNGRSPSAIDSSRPAKPQRFADRMYGQPYPCEELGNDSLAWWLHRELVRQGKPHATVYAHTTSGHTTRNHFLRVFSRWGSADLVNILLATRRVPPARLTHYKRDTSWDGVKGEVKRARLRNANRIRTLSTISAKYYSYAWCNGPEAPSEGESQRKDDIAAEESQAASPLIALLNTSQEVLDEQLVYEAPDRAYIRGLTSGIADTALSEHFTYQAIAATTTPLRLSVQLMKYVQMLRYRTEKAMTPVRVGEDGNRLVVRVAGAHAAQVLAAAQTMVQQGLFTAAAGQGNDIQLDLQGSCPCEKPKENFPYSADTFAMVTSIKDLVVTYAKRYDVPPVAVAGSIADEFNTRTGLRFGFDWLQDNVLLNFAPNFAIEFSAFLGSGSKVNLTKHDIGIGNIRLETAKELYDMYPGAFAQKNWDYTDLVDYIRTNEGTVHIASLVILRARQLFDRYLAVYSDKRKEAVYVTYYKQGPSYLKRYQDALAADPNRLLSPGEGCRVCQQRDKLLQALGL